MFLKNYFLISKKDDFLTLKINIYSEALPKKIIINDRHIA